MCDDGVGWVGLARGGLHRHGGLGRADGRCSCRLGSGERGELFSVRGFEGFDAEQFEGLEVGDAREQEALELGAGLAVRVGIGGLFQPLEHESQGLDGVFGSAQAQRFPPVIAVDAKRFTEVASKRWISLMVTGNFVGATSKDQKSFRRLR